MITSSINLINTAIPNAIIAPIPKTWIGIKILSGITFTPSKKFGCNISYSSYLSNNTLYVLNQIHNMNVHHIPKLI